jgi:sugar O-acyltransferase (sialic acid O-acetyltransferase NeuD family)
MIKALIGAGGFANEIKAQMGDYSMKCFVEDNYYVENTENISPISELDITKYELLIAIGDSKLREKIANSLPKETKYFTFIHPSAQIFGKDVTIGEGSVICAGSIITTNCKIGKHAQLNLLTTIGHDCQIDDYFTTAPGTKISGNCKIGKHVYTGTNSSVRQNIEICNDVTVGLNAGVVKNILISGTYVGLPAKKI